MKKANYSQTIKDTGEIIELMGFYEDDERIITNPPDMFVDGQLDEIIEMLRAANIKRADIIL